MTRGVPVFVVAGLLALASSVPAFAQAPPVVAPPVVAPPVVAPPKRIGRDSVPYPEGGSGDAFVRLVVTVGVDGAVGSAIAEESSPPFSGAAVAAARVALRACHA